MDMREPGRESAPDSPRVFATTHWSVVVAAGQDESAPARNALETLCRAYWYPIYVYVRRKGYGPDDAQDLTQAFFAQLISKHHLRLADRNKGKFRTFLLATLDYFLAREWSRAHRQKRGGQFSQTRSGGLAERCLCLDQPGSRRSKSLQSSAIWCKVVQRSRNVTRVT